LTYHVDLHRGRGEFVLYAADLTENYVAFNKGDITDPATSRLMKKIISKAATLLEALPYIQRSGARSSW